MAKDFLAISTEYLADIDWEIERLQTLRTQIADLLGAPSPKPRKAAKPAKAPRRFLSPEARERIAAAQRKRWAIQKRAVKAGKKAPAKKAAAKQSIRAKAPATNA